MILAGDIGGTKTTISLQEEVQDTALRVVAEATYRSEEHASLAEILQRFLESQGPLEIDRACFGVAGPVVDGRATTTNLPWPAPGEEELASLLGAARCRLLNDLEAAAYGVLVLPDDQRSELNPDAQQRPGNIAVVAAGTGLGEAILYWDGERHHVVPSEAGHADFAPRDEVEMGLLRFLNGELGGRVSYERVLSGPGLSNIYRYLRSTSSEPEPDWLAEQCSKEDPSAVICAAALEQRDPICARALERFVSLYGAEAGNAALRATAAGGVALVGGIAPKILPALKRGFLPHFVDKGRFEPYLRQIPVTVSLDPRTPLLGAAEVARQLSAEQRPRPA